MIRVFSSAVIAIGLFAQGNAKFPLAIPSRENLITITDDKKVTLNAEQLVDEVSAIATKLHIESHSVKDYGAKGDGVTDDTAAIQVAIRIAEANRIANMNLNGTSSIFFPRGDYIISAPLIVNLNRIRIYGEGSRSSVIRLKEGVILPNPSLQATQKYWRSSGNSTDFRLPPLVAGQELVKSAMLTTTRGRHMGWSIEHVGFEGNGISLSRNNTCVALYAMQQTGTIRDVWINGCGGNGLYLGLGDTSNPSPESGSISLVDIEISATGDATLHHTHSAYLNVVNSHFEGSKYGDCVIGQGVFMNSHVEHCRFGWNLQKNFGTVQTTLINPSGYAVGSQKLGFSAPESMIVTDGTRGVTVYNGTSAGFLNYACIDTGSGCVNGVKYPEVGTGAYFNNLTIAGYNQHQTIQLGAPQPLGGGFPADPLIVRARTAGASTARFIDNASDTDSTFSSSIDFAGTGKAFIITPDRNESGTYLSINYQGAPIYQFKPSGLTLQKPIKSIQSTGCGIYGGIGSPESVVIAPSCSVYLRSDGGSSDSVYFKVSGEGSTGWRARSSISELNFEAVSFMDLGSPKDGTLKFCKDCSIAAICSRPGTGAIAKRIGGKWMCN